MSVRTGSVPRSVVPATPACHVCDGVGSPPASGPQRKCRGLSRRSLLSRRLPHPDIREQSHGPTAAPAPSRGSATRLLPFLSVTPWGTLGLRPQSLLCPGSQECRRTTVSQRGCPIQARSTRSSVAASSPRACCPSPLSRSWAGLQSTAEQTGPASLSVCCVGRTQGGSWLFSRVDLLPFACQCQPSTSCQGQPTDIITYWTRLSSWLVPRAAWTQGACPSQGTGAPPQSLGIPQPGPHSAGAASAVNSHLAPCLPLHGRQGTHRQEPEEQASALLFCAAQGLRVTRRLSPLWEPFWRGKENAGPGSWPTLTPPP